MAFTTLMIDYMKTDQDSDFVHRTFDSIFGTGFVKNVDEISFDGYKKFYINVDLHQPKLAGIFSSINNYTFAVITYKTAWDEKQGKYVDFYWQVCNTCVEFKAPEKLVRSTNEMPPEEEKEPEELEDADAADIEKDFAELAAALARFGEDYPGCIARKIARPYHYMSEISF
jgi:hypothetical protein